MFTVDGNRVVRTVGYIAFCLPFALLLSSALTGGPVMYSISHYYYTRLGGDVLVGGLSIIGVILVFFFTYESSAIKQHPTRARINAILAIIAGLAAMGVAYIPTTGWGVQPPAVGENSTMALRVFLANVVANGSVQVPETLLSGIIHNGFSAPAGQICQAAENRGIDLHAVSALVMFLILSYYSACVFTLVHSNRSLVQNGKRPGELTAQKRKRNRWYRVLGLLILAAILGLVAKFTISRLKGGDCAPEAQAFLEVWNGYRLTLIAESIGMCAFGVSWAIKGRRFSSLNDPAARPIP